MARRRSFGAAAREYRALARKLREGVIDPRSIAPTAQALVNRQARRDLGSDAAFTRWGRERKPLPLDIRVRVLDDAPGVMIHPTRYSAGGFTVATVGRKSYAAGDRRAAGTYFRKRDQQVVTRRRRVTRSVGGYDGKGTADRIVADFQAEIPKLVELQLVRTITDTLGD